MDRVFSFQVRRNPPAEQKHPVSAQRLDNFFHPAAPSPIVATMSEAV
jgi:hypothetical protein